MNVESQLRALGTRLDDVQEPITADDIAGAHSAAGAGAGKLRRDPSPNGPNPVEIAEQDPDREMEVIMLSPDRKHEPTRRRAWLALAAAAAIVLVVVAGLAIADRSDDDPPTQPATVPTNPTPVEEAPPGPVEVIEQYRVAFNSRDIDAVMALFTDESTIVDHPLAATDIAGLDLIRRVHLSDLGMAADSDAYELSNIEASGDTVTWDSAWTNDEGATYCAQGHRAVITDGTILTWTWPPDNPRCD